MKKMILILSCMLLSVGMAIAQTKASGTIVDEQGEAIIGASISVPNTKIGTVTDDNGKFSLQVPASATTISIKSVGMKEQLLSPSTKMNITLISTSKDLDAVMVVAYSTAKKSTFTGSASQVKGNDLLSSSSESVDKALTGKISGVRVTSDTGDPGSSGDIQIRGIGSITGNTAPLYVIDGVPTISGSLGASYISSNVLSTLNPDDIASITVLKDAAAASLYGSQAANGVVIITTKKGKAGVTKFKFSANAGWSNMATDSYKMMSGTQYADYFKSSLEGYYLNDNNALVPGDTNYGNAAINLEAKAWAQKNYLDPNWSNLTQVRNGEDWRKDIYSGGSNQDYQLSASGGSEKTNYFASIGVKKVKGLVRERSFDRYSTILNVDNKAKKWLDLNFKTQLSYTNQIGVNDQSDQVQGMATASPLSLLMSSDPTAFAYNQDGSMNMNASFSSKVQNPLWALSPEQGFMKNKTYRGIINIGATVQILPELSFRTTNGVDYIDVKSYNYWGPNSIDGESLNGLGEKYDNEVVILTTSNIFNYKKTFNKVHNIDAMAGMEIQNYKNNYLYASTSNYSTDKLPELANASTPLTVTSSFYNRYKQSFLGDLKYNYADKYYLGTSIRSDASSQLGAANRHGTFYSFSGAWRFSQEKFLKNNILTDGKLRFSYGTNGALPTGTYSQLGLYYFGAAYGTESAIYMNQVQNDKLSWEKSKNINFGLDATIFHRFTFSLEYFNKHTSDLLLNVPSSYLTGVSSSLQNYGEISNSGLEFEFHGNDILKQKKLKWNIDFSLSTLKSKVVKLPDGQDLIMGDGNLYLYREGMNLYTFYLPTYVGVDKESGLGQFLIDPSKPATANNLTYYYSKAGRGPQGSAYPTVSGGFSNSFSWNNFTLNGLITYQFGGELFDYPGYFSHTDGLRLWSLNSAADVAGNYWQNPGDAVDNPRPVLNNPLRSDRWSTRQLHSTDFVRIKELSLSYNVPHLWCSRIGLENASLSFSANNLGFLYVATKGMDPEVALDGYRTTDTPPARTYTFGLSLGF